MRVALDAFGGDACPVSEVEGAIQAARDGVAVVLVGDEDRLETALSDFPDWERLPISVHHASDTISMADAPAKAVRGKPEASMPVAFDLVKRGEADAVLSAGNSGAMLACGLFKFRRIQGVDRPALVTSLPTARNTMVAFLDVGANVECRPVNLVQWAVMGAVYATFHAGRAVPRVGLLSNGTEDSKGTDLTRVVHRLLCDATSEDFEYSGYVEGDDLFSGDVDVVVTDGFTGNVALKVAEATGRMIAGWLKRAVTQDARSKAGALLLRPAFSELRTMLDPDTYGAAPLLGVRGGAFICHGRASATAIATSLRFVARSIREDLLPRLGGALERHAELIEESRVVSERDGVESP